ncbi:transposase [Rhodophyticola sp. CCM32]|nr:transposase [Rhodophyticola sp. CCM32]
MHLGDSQIVICLIQGRKREVILSRRVLTDRQWAIIELLVPCKQGDRGRTGADNRLFLDAILWLARGASPWRDLPPELGNWRTVHSRLRRWSEPWERHRSERRWRTRGFGRIFSKR